MRLLSNIFRAQSSYQASNRTFAQFASKSFAEKFASGENWIQKSSGWAKDLLKVKRTDDSSLNILAHIGKQCLAIGSQRTKKMVKVQVEDVMNLCNRCRNVMVDSMKIRLNGMARGSKSKVARSLLLSSVAFHWKRDDDTLNR